MALTFRIAAGIVIGFLVLQIIQMQMYPPDYFETLNTRQQEYEKYKGKIFLVKSAIGNYYRKHKILPGFVSDLKCPASDFVGNKENECAYVQADGVFFVNYKKDWAAYEPYLSDGKLLYHCRVNLAFVKGDDRFSHCTPIDEVAIPEKKRPSFDCTRAITHIEEAICGSDRLIESDIKLSAVYKKVLSRSATAKAAQIKHEQIEFIERRQLECLTEGCIDNMTRERVAELERY